MANMCFPINEHFELLMLLFMPKGTRTLTMLGYGEVEKISINR
jgi:hypothetical protein